VQWGAFAFLVKHVYPVHQYVGTFDSYDPDGNYGGLVQRRQIEGGKEKEGK
jgi:hypothetical protein